MALSDVVSQQFTVGKLDAGIAILLSPDHHLIEFPATILPDGVTTGSIINLTIERNLDEERHQREEFLELQQTIYEHFSQVPETPVLSLRSVTQTSATIQWEPLDLKAADLRGIDIYRNSQKLNIPIQPGATTAKLSGLDVSHEYEIWIVVRTSSGHYHSNHITVKTHSLENLTGINVCFGTLSNDGEMDSLIDLLGRIGASYTEELTTDNTHLICTFARGPKYEKALEWNIPAVSPEFLKACEQNGKSAADDDQMSIRDYLNARNRQNFGIDDLLELKKKKEELQGGFSEEAMRKYRQQLDEEREAKLRKNDKVKKKKKKKKRSKEQKKSKKSKGDGESSSDEESRAGDDAQDSDRGPESGAPPSAATTRMIVVKVAVAAAAGWYTMSRHHGDAVVKVAAAVLVEQETRRHGVDHVVEQVVEARFVERVGALFVDNAAAAPALEDTKIHRRAKARGGMKAMMEIHSRQSRCKLL